MRGTFDGENGRKAINLPRKDCVSNFLFVCTKQLAKISSINSVKVTETWDGNLYDGLLDCHESLLDNIGMLLLPSSPLLLMRMMGLALDVVVAEVCGEVHAEADAHDEVDEGDPVQHDAPQGHEPQGSLF